jgi:hypothetical protein
VLANKTLVCQHLNDTDLSMNQIVKFVLAKKTLDCQHFNDTNLSMNWIFKRIEKTTFSGATIAGIARAWGGGGGGGGGGLGSMYEHWCIGVVQLLNSEPLPLVPKESVLFVLL